MQGLLDGTNVHPECFQPSESRAYRNTKNNLAKLKAEQIELERKPSFVAKLFSNPEKLRERSSQIEVRKRRLEIEQRTYRRQVGIQSIKVAEAKKYKDRIVGLWPGYPPEPYWEELRKAAAASANFRCEACRKNINLNEGHAHHNVQLRFGGFNELKNLSWLCRNCHQKRHSHKLRSGRPVAANRRNAATPKQAKTPLQKIDLCISQQKKLRIEYLDGNGELTTRTIRPIKRFVEGDESIKLQRVKSGSAKRRKWVEAYCYKRRANRNFRIDRIKSTEILE